MIPPSHPETIHTAHTLSHHRILIEVPRVDPVWCTQTWKVKITDLDLEVHSMSLRIAVHPRDTTINETTRILKDARVTLRLTYIHRKNLLVHPLYSLIIIYGYPSTSRHEPSASIFNDSHNLHHLHWPLEALRGEILDEVQKYLKSPPPAPLISADPSVMDERKQFA